MPKIKYSAEQKEKIALQYLNLEGSSYDLSNIYGVSAYTIRIWAQKYQHHGIEAFYSNRKNQFYSSEFKKECVELYLKGLMSIDEIVASKKISARGVLQHWIKKYNANRELKDYSPKREVYMAEARRKTTIEERKEIVDYCINHNRNYKDTAALYDVSYSQVYSWVKKYDANGDEALTDKRGRHKTDNEIDELERLRRENLRLKRQLKEKDMLTELLKKVNELERM